MQEPTHPELDFYVLIPCYNNLSGLIQSLQSIYYDGSKYGVVIVDDGSREAISYANLAAHIDPRVRVEILWLRENAGITKALNTGLEWLEGRADFRYVARLDCGDLCDSKRFTRQVEFLNQHTDIDMVGSWCIFKNFLTNLTYQYKTPTEHGMIMKGMYSRNIFRHSTVMWRANVVAKAGFYPENFPHAEDYGFFYQILNKGKGAVIPENLVICDINPKSISMHFRKEQLISRRRVVQAYGKNKLLVLFGIIKIWLLMVIPYGLILQTKRLIYGIKLLCVI